MKRYEVRYGTPVNFKVVKTEYRDRAEGVFATAKRFAEKHNLNWIPRKKHRNQPRLMMAPGKGRNLPAASWEGRGNHLHIVNEILGGLRNVYCFQRNHCQLQLF